MEPLHLVQDEYLCIVPWKNMFPTITAGFTTKNRGYSQEPFSTLNLGLHVNDSKDHVIQNRGRLAGLLHFPLEDWVCSEQVHDHHIKKVTKADRGKGVMKYEEGIPCTDGVYTSEANILLTSVYADCVPLYFIEPSRGLIGLAHAGWKGTVREIASRMVRCWVEEEGVQAENIHVCIGPSILNCCYVVDDYVINEVKKVLDDQDVLPFIEISPGQYSLNLAKLNQQILLKAGVQEENIIMSSRCTSCEDQLFFSHRRDRGKTGRMMSFIGYKED
ncbi:peptidoglycan editing factor PgeF [Bacillus pinisoli]|uniref:peptidoglycan editing factor PgeF n=1 Tax=Bacillus pinisoli TaxID=2901866 RepID=UPI001FF3FC87|nr:peptidoglycan editing factor PgeF [Bacillus pinisoli]